MGVQKLLWLEVIIALGLLLALALAWADQKNHSRWRIILKMSAASLFLLIAIQSPFETALHYWIFIGLIFGFMGDAALLWQKKSIFLGGIVAFLLGHVFYVVAWLPSWQLQVLFHPMAWVYLVISLCIMPYLWGFVSGGMRVAVVAYIIVITLMGFSAVGQWLHSSDFRYVVGPLVFVLSDISVALDRFTDLPRWHRCVGIPLYFLGQYIIATTIVF